MVRVIVLLGLDIIMVQENIRTKLPSRVMTSLDMGNSLSL